MKRKTLLVIGLVCVLAAAVAGGIAIAHSPSSSSAKKAKLQLRSGKLGHFVVDARGMTLYLFEKDKHGKSACSGTCAKVWAPYLTSGKPTAGRGLAAAKVGTSKRSSGGTPGTHRGHPLHPHADAPKPGPAGGAG